MDWVRKVGCRWWDFFILSTIFTSGLHFNSPIGVFYFAFFQYFIYIFRAVLIKKIILPSFLIGLSFFCFFYSVLVALINEGDPFKSIASLIILLVIFSSYLAFFCEYDFDLELIFSKYISVAKIFVYLAFFQEFFLLAGGDPSWVSVNAIFKQLDFFWGVPGLSAEPAEFSVVIAPALFYCFYRVYKFRTQFFDFFLFLVGIGLSSSSLGIIGMLLCVLVILSDIRKSFLGMMLFFPFAVLALSFFVGQDYFLVRLYDSLELFSNMEWMRPEGYNLSSYSQAVNYNIVLMSVVDTMGLGVGLANYTVVFDRFVDLFYFPGHRDDIPGRGTATSLFLRVVGEFGIAGGVWLTYFLWKFRLGLECSVVNAACFIFIILVYLRMGIYFSNGVAFFMLIYYLSYKNYYRA